MAADLKLRRAEAGAEKMRAFTSFTYAAKSWRRERRVVARLAATISGFDAPYVVPSLPTAEATHLTEDDRLIPALQWTTSGPLPSHISAKASNLLISSLVGPIWSSVGSSMSWNDSVRWLLGMIRGGHLMYAPGPSTEIRRVAETSSALAAAS